MDSADPVFRVLHTTYRVHAGLRLLASPGFWSPMEASKMGRCLEDRLQDETRARLRPLGLFLKVLRLTLRFKDGLTE